MVRTEDLMIGNWVLVEDKPRQVKSITKKKIGFHYRPNENRLYYARCLELKPIELNHLSLTKAGFLYDNKSRAYYRKGYAPFIVCRDLDMFFIRVIGEKIPVYVRYMHELQNLIRTTATKQINIEYNEE